MSNASKERGKRDLLPPLRHGSPLGPAPDSPKTLDLKALPAPSHEEFFAATDAPADASERFAFALWNEGRKDEAIEFLERQILRRKAGELPASPDIEPVEAAEEPALDVVRSQNPPAEAPTKDEAPVPVVTIALPRPFPATREDAALPAAGRKRLRAAAIAAALVVTTGAVLATNYLAPPADPATAEADATSEPTISALPSPLRGGAGGGVAPTAEKSSAAAIEPAANTPSPPAEVAAAAPPPEAEDSVPAPAVRTLAASEPVPPQTPVAGPSPAPGLAALVDNAPPPEELAPPPEEIESTQPEPSEPGPLDPLFAAMGMPASADRADRPLAGGMPQNPDRALETLTAMQPGAPASILAAESFALAPRVPNPRPEFSPEMLVAEAPRVARAEAPPDSPAPHSVPTLYDPSPGDALPEIPGDYPPGTIWRDYGDGRPVVVWRAPDDDARRRFWRLPDADRLLFWRERDRDEDIDPDLAWRRAEAERYIAWRRAQRRHLHLTFP